MFPEGQGAFNSTSAPRQGLLRGRGARRPDAAGEGHSHACPDLKCLLCLSYIQCSATHQPAKDRCIEGCNINIMQMASGLRLW